MHLAQHYVAYSSEICVDFKAEHTQLVTKHQSYVYQMAKFLEPCKVPKEPQAQH